MSPRLPVEIILSILEIPFAIESRDYLTTKPSQFLLINRGIHGHLLHSLYRTIILKSYNQLLLLSRTSHSSPHLMKLISNIWVCAPLLAGLSIPRQVEAKLLSTTLPSILLSSTSLQRLAVPSIGPHFTNALMLLQKTQPLVPNLHTLFVGNMALCPGAPMLTHFTNVKRLLAPLPFSKGQRMVKDQANFLGEIAARSIGPSSAPLEEIAFCVLAALPVIPPEDNWETSMARGRSRGKLAISFSWMTEDDNMFLFDKWLKG
jgi:hypothetical protein